MTTITQLPRRPEDYRNFFKTLAENHAYIGHSDDGNQRFVTVSDDMLAPWKAADLKEFIDGVRSKLHYGDELNGRKLVMVLLEPAYDFDGIQRGLNDVVDGGLWLLTKVRANDHEEKRDVYEMAFEACRDIVTFTHLFNEANSRLMQIENVKADPIGPLTSDNLHGYRLQFNIGFKTGLNDISDIFSGLEPTRILNDNGPYTT